MMKITITAICFLITPFFYLVQRSNNESLKIFHVNPFALSASYVDTVSFEFNDTIPGNTLYINRSEEGYPVSCYRKIMTGVCIDNECRILRVVLHWTMTGRYLGFELPEGEFLSKTEHEKFTMEEYNKMHELLSNPYSLLANFSLDELAPKKNPEVDGETGATMSDVLAYSVEGAVYTTYTMWHLVYGDTRRKIIKNTEKELTADLLQIILKSTNFEDKVWGLNHIWGYVEPSDELYDLVFDIIQNEDTDLAERVIDVIPPEELGSVSIQQRLFNRFYLLKPEVKRYLLKKMQHAPRLHGEIAVNLVAEIEKYEEFVIIEMLDLLLKHNVNESELLRNVAGLLPYDNRRIAQKAYLYLQGMDIQNEEIKQLMNENKLHQEKIQENK